MTRETSTAQPAATGPERWVRRTLHLWVSRPAVQELETVCCKLFELAPGPAPDRDALRQALWHDLAETVRALLTVARDEAENGRPETAGVVQRVLTAALPAVERLREEGYWPPAGSGMVRWSALLFLSGREREILESVRTLVAAGRYAEGLCREIRPARTDLSDILQELDDLAAAFGAIGEAGGAKVAADAAAGIRTSGPEEGDPWRELLEECGGILETVPLEVSQHSARRGTGCREPRESPRPVRS